MVTSHLEMEEALSHWRHLAWRKASKAQVHLQRPQFTWSSGETGYLRQSSAWKVFVAAPAHGKSKSCRSAIRERCSHAECQRQKVPEDGRALESVITWNKNIRVTHRSFSGTEPISNALSSLTLMTFFFLQLVQMAGK
jgi:hypothetical protein